MAISIFSMVDNVQQQLCIKCSRSKLRSALKIASGSLSGGVRT